MTDCERLLKILSDRKPHGHRELYRKGIMVHSRVADLRKRGYQVECRNVGRAGRRALYEYQLVGSLPQPSSQSCSSFGDDDLPHRVMDAGRDDGFGKDSPRSGVAVHGSPPAATPETQQLALALPGSVYRKDVAA